MDNNKKDKKVSITALIIVGCIAVVIITLLFTAPAIYNAIGKVGKNADFFKFDTNGISYTVNNDEAALVYGESQSGEAPRRERVAAKTEIKFNKMILAELDGEVKPVAEVYGYLYVFYNKETPSKIFDGIVGASEYYKDAPNMFEYKDFVVICAGEKLYIILKYSNESLVKKILPSGDRRVLGEFSAELKSEDELGAL